MRFSNNQIEVYLQVSPQDHKLSIRERTGPERTLEIEQRADQPLRIRLIGDDIILLEQNSDGLVRWVDIACEKVSSVRSDSFAQLRDEHKEALNNRLVPILKHCGIGVEQF